MDKTDDNIEIVCPPGIIFEQPTYLCVPRLTTL